MCNTYGTFITYGDAQSRRISCRLLLFNTCLIVETILNGQHDTVDSPRHVKSCVLAGAQSKALPPFIDNSPLLLTGLPPAGRPVCISTARGSDFYSLPDLIYHTYSCCCDDHLPSTSSDPRSAHPDDAYVSTFRTRRHR